MLKRTTTTTTRKKKKKKKKINYNYNNNNNNVSKTKQTDEQTKNPLKEYNLYLEINDLNAIKEPHSQVFTPAGCRQLNKASES